MAFFTDLDQHLTVLRDVVGADVEASALPATVVSAGDADVLRVIAETTAAIEALGVLRITASGVLAARSRREQGHDGAAAGEGHRNAVSLVQEIAGTTRTDAAKQVKLGESLLSGANLFGGAGAHDLPPALDGDADMAGDLRDASPIAEPWHAPLGRAQLSGQITAGQHHAILRGLADPPVTGDRAVDAEYVAAWSLAAEQLIHEAPHRTVDELGSAARTIRDRLDPVGAGERFQARFQGRSFRMWKDAEGVGRAYVTFDDESYAFLKSVFDSAMRPRRGGPRFVDAEEKARAEELEKDPRSNDQLQFDLALDIFRAGTLADAKAVHGTKQAGVRIVITVDDFDTTTSADATDPASADPASTDTASADPASTDTASTDTASTDTAGTGHAGVAHTEDGITTLPAWLAAQKACDTGTRTIWVDGAGEPLRLGREQRLFSSGQRLALAIRDGGCRWKGCDRPASMCEAHHIDKYSEGGRTDTDRGILLCRFHHMNLHHGAWRITRAGLGDFVLHPPSGRGDPITLVPRLATTAAWAGIDPPPQRFRPPRDENKHAGVASAHAG